MIMEIRENGLNELLQSFEDLKMDISESLKDSTDKEMIDTQKLAINSIKICKSELKKLHDMEIKFKTVQQVIKLQLPFSMSEFETLKSTLLTAIENIEKLQGELND